MTQLEPIQIRVRYQDMKPCCITYCQMTAPTWSQDGDDGEITRCDTCNAEAYWFEGAWTRQPSYKELQGKKRR